MDPRKRLLRAVWTHNLPEPKNVLESHPSLDVHHCEIGHGWSPIENAVAKGFHQGLALLLAHPSVDVDKRNQQFTLLELACFYGQTEAVRLLLRHPKITFNFAEKNRSPLFWACYENHLETLKMGVYLLRHTAWT